MTTVRASVCRRLGSDVKRAIFEAKTRLLMRRDRAAFDDMLRSERLAPEAARALTLRRSAAIASYAFATSPFYRELYGAAGFTPADLAQPDNFEHLPRITKADLQEHGERILVEGAEQDRALPSRTGGSTGRPLLAYNDAEAPTAALWWRVYSWWGIHPADNAAFIYRQARTGRAKLAYDLEWWPTRHILLDARGTTEASTAAFASEIKRVRPMLLVGYLEGVRALAEYTQEHGNDTSSLRAISVTASVMIPGQRRYVEEVLGAPVFDTYRTAEIPWIAAECTAHSGLHVQSDRRRVDVVDPSGRPTSEVGELLVTDFDNRVFPLIRYAIGDRAAVVGGPCPCGRSLARISAIDGRIADALRTPSGRTVSGGLGGLFNNAAGAVRQFQVHQAADFGVVIRYVPAGDLGAAEDAAEVARRMVSGFLNHEVVVRAEPVSAIESIGGKARLVTSEVPG
jgi:phenylacetate-CoA ligase